MKKQSSQAMAAAAIRKELKEKFPKIKFSVTSRGFSGGDSVDIHWENGVTCDQVCEITDKYQYGSFDGMNDSYNIDNRISGLPQAKYVCEQRKITDEIFNEAFEYIRHSWACLRDKNIDDASQEMNKQLGCWTARQFLYRHLNKMDLTEGFSHEALQKQIYG